MPNINLLAIMARLRIKEVLKEQGVTQQELAVKIGVSRVGLAKAIGGNPTINTLEKIATALNVDIVDLFDTSTGQTLSGTINCPECGAKLKINIEADKH